MATKQALKTKRPTLAYLSKEVALLRSLLIGLIDEDAEGRYRTEFVKKIREASLEVPTHVYRGKGSLLRALKKK